MSTLVTPTFGNSLSSAFRRNADFLCGIVAGAGVGNYAAHTDVKQAFLMAAYIAGGCAIFTTGQAVIKHMSKLKNG